MITSAQAEAYKEGFDVGKKFIELEKAEEIASLRARIAELEEKLGECASAHRATHEPSPKGLGPAGGYPFREAELDGTWNDAIEACAELCRSNIFLPAREAIAQALILTAKGKRWYFTASSQSQGEEDARASDDELPHDQRLPDTNLPEPVE